MSRIVFCAVILQIFSLSAHAVPRTIKCSVDYSKTAFTAADFNGFEGIKMDFFAPQAATGEIDRTGTALVHHTDSGLLSKTTVYAGLSFDSGFNPDTYGFNWYENFNRVEDPFYVANDTLELHKNLTTKTWSLRRVNYWRKGISGCEPREDKDCEEGHSILMEIPNIECTDTDDLIVYDPAETERLIKTDPCHRGD